MYCSVDTIVVKFCLLIILDAKVHMAFSSRLTCQKHNLVFTIPFFSAEQISFLKMFFFFFNLLAEQVNEASTHNLEKKIVHYFDENHDFLFLWNQGIVV